MSDVTIKKETKEFFVFSYFNIIPKGLFDIKKENKESFSEFYNYEEYLAYKCAYRAYLDLNRTLIVNKNISNTQRKALVYDICGNLIKDIKKLFNKTNDKDFDDKHKEICINLKNYINNKSELLQNREDTFSVGQAQKWLNMTLKYMWLLGLLENKLKTVYLHVPVDSYIIKAVWENENIILPIVKKLKNGSRGAYSSEKVVAWSKWDYEMYIDFQNSLKEVLGNQSRIEWEHTAWMEFAE